MYGYIYKTTNLISGKIYIGKRVSKYFLPSYLGSGTKLRAAVKGYGKEKFTVELIEEFESETELDAAEIYYIKLFNCQNPEIGYNIGPGGEGGNNLALISKRSEYKQRAIEGQIKAFGKKGESILVHKEHVTKRIKKDEVLNYLSEEWEIGRFMTPEEKEQRKDSAKRRATERLEKMSTQDKKIKYGNPGEKNPRYGRHWDEAHKQQHSTTLKKGYAEGKYKSMVKNKIAIHKPGDISSIYINKTELENYIKIGYVKGITETEALKRRHKGYCKGSSKKVKCIETGEIFSSKKELMQKFNISIATLNGYIKRQEKVKWINLTFEEVKDE